MKNWTSQIVIGIIVTVIGTVLANAVTRGLSGKKPFGSHYSGSHRSGR